MKRDRLWKHLLIAFTATLILYILGFSWVEHRRTRLGPWRVTFVNEIGVAPRVAIDQPGLGITNFLVQFPATLDAHPTNVTLAFQPGRAVPFKVPFGNCVFMDPLFLPGTVTLDLFQHQLQLQPRVLTVDGVEYEWDARERVVLEPPP